MVLARIFQESVGFRSAKHEENIKTTRFWNVSKIAFVFALSRDVPRLYFVRLANVLGIRLLTNHEVRSFFEANINRRISKEKTGPTLSDEAGNIVLLIIRTITSCL